MTSAVRSSGSGRIDLVEFVDVSYPRVRRLLRDVGASLFDPAGVSPGAAASTTTAAFGVSVGDIHVGTGVEIRFTGLTTLRFPLPSTQVSIECRPTRMDRFVEGMTAELTAYPVSRSVTGLTLEGVYRPTAGHHPGRLLVHRAVRVCVEDMLDRLVTALRNRAPRPVHV